MNLSHKLISILALAPVLLQAVSCSKLPFTVQCPSASCDVNVVHISQADVGPSGYFITTPGVYCLIEDINWAPTSSGAFGIPAPAITIDVPAGGDVVLNLNGYYLSQAPGNTQIFTAGIKVTSNMNNIIIENGTVKNFGTVGIYIDPVVNLTLRDLTVNNIGAAGGLILGLDTAVVGIAISGISDFSSSGLVNIDNVHVYGVSPTLPIPSLASYGLYITATFEVNIRNSSFSRNINYLGQVGGLNITTSNAQVRLYNVEANENYGLTNAYGMLFQYLMDVECVNCNACANSINGVVATNSNAGVPYIADGIVFNTCIDYTLINCRADQNIANVTSTAATGPIQHASGFEAYRSMDGNFEGCVANSNFAPGFTGGSAYGFHIGSDNTKLTNCFATNNAGWDTAWGIASELFFNDIYFFFGTEGFQGNIVIDKAVTEYNIVTSGTGSLGGGIKLQDTRNSVISNSVSSNNSTDGILLVESAACNTVNNLIQSNKLISNSVWGIQDLTANNDNIYIDNRAINNPGVGGVTNFDPGVRNSGGDLTNGFIVPWAVPGAPPAVATVDKISNLDITSSCPPVIT